MKRDRVMMRALRFDGKKLILDDHYPVPESGENEALVKILLAGICDTDLQIVSGYMGFEGILGHEFVGTVAESDDQSLLGKTVVGEINIGCNVCAWCLSSEKEHCPDRKVLGILNKDGVFAEYVSLPLTNLKRVPPTIPLQQAVFVEPLAAALQIQQQISIKPEQRVLIIGDGKLGSLIAQVLHVTGCELHILGRHTEKLSAIKHNCPNIQMAKSPRALSRERFEIVIEVSGRSDGLNMALELVQPRGTVVLKSTTADTSTVDHNLLVINEISIIGSRCGPFDAALRMLSSGKINTDYLIEATYPLSEGLQAFHHALQKGTRKILLDPTK